MTDDPSPTTSRRQLGARLRRLRQGQNLTANEVAAGLGFSVSKISRMESGDRAVNEQDMTALVGFFAVQGSDASELIELAREGRKRRSPAATVPAPELDHQAFVRSGFVELERDAEAVREFNGGVIPGLLQNAAYMRALMLSSVVVDDQTLGRAIDLRLRRQDRIRPGGTYSAIIDEAVLTRPVGSPSVMRDQIDCLLRRLGDRSADIRIIPFDVGPHPALNTMFVMLTLENAGLVDAVFSEGLTGYLTFQRSEDIDRFERAWADLVALSTSSEGTLSLLRTYRAKYSD